MLAATVSEATVESTLTQAIAEAAYNGLTANAKTLPPWLFYDEAGSQLFEQITELPEYYLTRTERGILAAHAGEMLARASEDRSLTLAELGAGTASKTGLLLAAAVHRQGTVLYQPIDVSSTALDEARENIEAHIPGVTVRPQVANYTTESIHLHRLPHTHTLVLYIGSSIGNFSPGEAQSLLKNLRAQLQTGDTLLLGTDLVKDEQTLLAAYNDDAGITAAFNKNILARLNRDLGADFHPDCFTHQAIWNAAESRIEMHLVATAPQRVYLPASAATPATTLHFDAGEFIHTENSYKFTSERIAGLLQSAGFAPLQTWQDAEYLFAVTLAAAE